MNIFSKIEQYFADIDDRRADKKKLNRALVEAVRLTVAELNAKYKRCTPIDNIDDSSYGGQLAIWVGGRGNFSLTLYMRPVNGDLMF